MNQTTELGLVGTWVFSLITIVMLYILAWNFGIAPPHLNKRVASNLEVKRVNNLMAQVQTMLEKILAMNLSLEQRLEVMDEYSKYMKTITEYNVWLPEENKTMQELLAQHRNWLSKFQDQLFTNAVKVDSPFYDYNR